ncbi:MAG: helix-turn-helix domain-containing protein [Nitrospirae bacterium]|nr:helix-turn-helix domain-containing protein [Nitrospirota bacterium]
MDTASPYMTVQDVAAYLRVKPKTIYAWAGEGRIPAVKLNGLLRFRRAEIDSWAESCERSSGRLATLPQGGRSRGGTARSIPPSGGIERIIDRVKNEVLHSRLGEARPAVKPGKEG